jgi:hypothetical protein
LVEPEGHAEKLNGANANVDFSGFRQRTSRNPHAVGKDDDISASKILSVFCRFAAILQIVNKTSTTTASRVNDGQQYPLRPIG